MILVSVRITARAAVRTYCLSYNHTSAELYYYLFSHYTPLSHKTVFSGIAVTEGRKSGDRAPGDFGFNPLNFGKTPATAKDLALKEIRNGRLAMWAAAGILLQGATTGSGALENAF